MFHSELFTLTMQEVRKRQPDLYFTLGDDFSIEKVIQDFKEANYPLGYSFLRSVEGVAPYSKYQTLPKPFLQPMIVDGKSAPITNAAYLELRNRYFGLMANATSLMLVNGNHEQAHLANIGGIFNNASVWAADGRLKYYLCLLRGRFTQVMKPNWPRKMAIQPSVPATDFSVIITPLRGVMRCL